MWCKIDRDIIHWDMFEKENIVALKVYLYLMATSRVEDTVASDGQVIKKGETLFSYRGISKALGISESKVRTAVKNLVITHKITQRVTRHYSVATPIFQGFTEKPSKKITHEIAHNFATYKDKEKEKYDFGKGEVIRKHR